MDQANKTETMVTDQLTTQPGQIAEIAKRHPEVVRARLEVTGAKGQDVMTLVCETASSNAALIDAVAQSLSTVTKLHGTVRLVAPGELPNDGKVIADLRSYA